ncbi:MAG TPA: hypothetical protein PLR99_07965 [Polyangiaceae bacterium]|nr:hypothetical protein [Polyangiaceae bacterium]
MSSPPRLSRLVRSPWLLSAALALVTFVAACRDRSVRCTKVTGALPGTVTFEGCTDGRERKITCSPVAGEKAEDIGCACMLRGKMGASFTLFSDSVRAADDPERATQIANRRCGFELSER